MEQSLKLPLSRVQEVVCIGLLHSLMKVHDVGIGRGSHPQTQRVIATAAATTMCFLLSSGGRYLAFQLIDFRS
jgi:hypothetical protein